MIDKPIFAVNFKTYVLDALKIAKTIKKYSKHCKPIICVQPGDVNKIAKTVNIPVYVEHVDYNSPGKNTGALSIENLMLNGAKGTILNHSEKRLDYLTLKKTIIQCKEKGFNQIVCVLNSKEAKKIAELKPTYIAVEPKELIGGNISVSKARPDLIRASVKNVKNLPLLCGAGIKSREDVRKAISLGAKGILVSSGVVCQKDVRKAVLNLTSGFYKE